MRSEAAFALAACFSRRAPVSCWDETLDPKELTECVEMLLQLEEPPEELCEEFLSHAGARLEAELAALEAELPPADPSSTATTPPPLPYLLATLASSVLGQLKAVLAYVQLFTAKDVAFASLPYFKGEFCAEAVREGLVVAFVRWLSPALLLLLARLCLDYEATTVSYILTLTDEQFPPQDTGPAVTPGPALCAEARGAAQRLLDHYVQVQGAAVAQMLRKSVETRDWLGTVEPRNVRAVMKRVVEDITAIDVQVGQLFEEGVRRGAPMDTHLLSNIQKLFSERIDIFSPVEFNKVSVLTGIIKISLKTLLECVRLRTLGRFGLQQVQVDGHYLQLYLWRFAADERVVQGLLDEVAASAAHRCLDPVPMEHSVVELICERG
ncbi:PREDICTED: vacuolar protein sorting-associated protein 51 homolog [Pygoscelis adeliae]|uniref:vacuolar protein sorting-associated protein 51 homolog n=1 Tax=Pygoscelis adeliae TaxID=9238 RepID=UPI0004F4FBB9|nr:PREDICTED: vacuolar protein sorting-associated protein 51 homolog [Pygoscelis adeliae]